MNDGFVDDEQPQIGTPTRFGFIGGFARRHFHAGRGGRAKLAVTTSLISRVVTAAVNFIVLPITVRYLGNEGYGLMITITSVVGWLQFTNAGIGLGLQNALTEEKAKENAAAQRQLVSTAVFSLAAIGAIVVAAGLLVFPHVDWTRVFPPVTARFTSEIPWTVLVVFIGFVSTVVLGFVGPIYSARQELHVMSIQTMVIGVAVLIGTFVAVQLRWGLLGLTLCTIGITGLLQWVFALWTLFGRGYPELRPAWSQVRRSAAQRIYRSGIAFFLLQIFSIAFFQIDAYLIAHFLTVDQVTPYSVAQRVFLQAAGIFSIITASLWGAYGNAKAQSEYQWIRRTHRKMVRAFVLVFGGIAVVMTLFGHVLLSWWVGTNAAPSTMLIVGIAMFFCAREWTNLHAQLLNALDVLRPQVWNLGLTALLTVTFDLLLVKRLGPLGLALGGFAAFTVAGAWYLPVLARRTLKSA